MLNKNDIQLLKVIKAKNMVSRYVIRDLKTAEAFLGCLELFRWEEKFFSENLEKLAKDAEDLFGEHILQLNRESFRHPYRKIVQEFYKFSDDEIAELENKFIKAQIL